jgi:hypothetical protein
MDSNHRKNTLTELQSVPFSHSGTPPVFLTTTHSFCVLVKECAKVIVFFIMSKTVPKKNAKKIKRREEISRKGGMETGENLKSITFQVFSCLHSSFLLFSNYSITTLFDVPSSPCVTVTKTVPFTFFFKSTCPIKSP